MRGVPRLRQIVTQPTHQQKILDVILTNMHQFYGTPVILPAVELDNPLDGVLSDHKVPLALPIKFAGENKSRDYVTRTFRPLPDSGIRLFGQWICNETGLT